MNDFDTLFPTMNTAQHHTGLWSLDSLKSADVVGLLDAAWALRQTQGTHTQRPLRGKNLALLCDEPCCGSLNHFTASATALGAHVVHIDAHKSRITQPEQGRDTAVMLGRLYDAIDCEDMPSDVIEAVEHDAGKPVFSGLACPDHPTHVMADLLTLRQASGKPLGQLTLCARGDADSPLLDAWLQLSALSGLNLCLTGNRPAAPRVARAQIHAQASGAHIEWVDAERSTAHKADFFWDEHSPSRCADGRAQLRSLHPLAAGTPSLGEAQVLNQGLIYQALLLNVLG